MGAFYVDLVHIAEFAVAVSCQLSYFLLAVLVKNLTSPEVLNRISRHDSQKGG